MSKLLFLALDFWVNAVASIFGVLLLLVFSAVQVALQVPPYALTVAYGWALFKAPFPFWVTLIGSLIPVPVFLITFGVLLYIRDWFDNLFNNFAPEPPALNLLHKLRSQ